MSTLKKNLTYQTIYQIFAVCIPLVTSPYLSRRLGADGLGIYSYNYSIVHYFMLFALLGVGQYGMRTIAQGKGEGRENVSKLFWSIYSFQFFTGILSTLVYTVLCFTIPTENRIVLFANMFYMAGELINISWLFFGLEKYRTTVLRNLLIKVFTVACIFIFVHNRSDLIKYVLILSFGQFLSNAVLWTQLRKYTDYVKPTWEEIRKHIRPNIVLFIPVLATSVYHIMDKTMLGMFSDDANSGYYYNADKLVNIPLTLIVACSSVFMTRISSLFGENKPDEARDTQNESIGFGLCAICAIAFGIAAVGNEFIPIFFGKGYEPCIELIDIFAFVVIFKTISTHTRTAFLIPEKKDKVYARAVLCGAVVNFIANYLLIKSLKLGAKGATIGTLIAEAVVCFMQITLMGKTDSRLHCVKGILKNSIYLVFGVIMFAVLYSLGHMVNSNVLNMLIKISVGIAVYSCACIILWKTKPQMMPSLFKESLGVLKKKLFKKPKHAV
ncbi:MAG: flippase [Clostridia bacterium]|nr:flippase [Clostridia bacterium]